MKIPKQGAGRFKLESIFIVKDSYKGSRIVINDLDMSIFTIYDFDNSRQYDKYKEKALAIEKHLFNGGTIRVFYENDYYDIKIINNWVHIETLY